VDKQKSGVINQDNLRNLRKDRSDHATDQITPPLTRHHSVCIFFVYLVGNNINKTFKTHRK